MTRAVFAREGWITVGNPNHYSGDGLLLREFRARCRDADCPGGLPQELVELEREFLAENGQKLTESNASAFGCGISDVVADYLSDAAPEGYVFELRRNRGNSNYGYFRIDDWITAEEFRVRVEREYGQPGVHAAESMCLDELDYGLGYDHCVERIAPALEEELISVGGLE